MNKIKIVILSIALTAAFYIGCHIYTNNTIERYKTMKRPIVLVHKERRTISYSVTLKDANGAVVFFSNASWFSNEIGNLFFIGDTVNINK